MLNCVMHDHVFAIVEFCDSENIDYPEWLNDFEFECDRGKFDYDKLDEDGNDLELFVDSVISDSLTECWEERLPTETEINWNCPSELLEEMGKKELEFSKRENAIFKLGFLMGLNEAGFIFAEKASVKKS